MLSHTSARDRRVNPSFVLANHRNVILMVKNKVQLISEAINHSSVKGICLIGAVATLWKGSGVWSSERTHSFGKAAGFQDLQAPDFR